MELFAPRVAFHPNGVNSRSARRFGWNPVTRIGRTVYITKLNGITIPEPGCPHVPLTLKEQAEILARKLEDICRRTAIRPENLNSITVRVKPRADISSLSRAYRILYDFMGDLVDKADWRLEKFPGPQNELIRLDAVGKVPSTQAEPVSLMRKAA